jgi:hypothetical protein
MDTKSKSIPLPEHILLAFMMKAAGDGLRISKKMKLLAKPSNPMNGISSGSNARVIRSRLLSTASLLQILKTMLLLKAL